MHQRLFVPFIALSFLAGCGDDGGSGSTVAPFQSSQSDERVVATMSDAEKQAFCQEIGTWFQGQVSAAEFKKLLCYSLSLAFSGGDAQACNASASECINDPETSGSFDDTDCDVSQVADCTATVAEMEACYTALATQFKSASAQASCSMSPAQLEALENQPPACATLEAKCPNLFGDEGDTAEPQ